jgi:hypothetical protein
MDDYLLIEFKSLLSKAPGYMVYEIPEAINYVSSIFDPSTPTEKLSFGDLWVMGAKLVNSVPQEYKQKLDDTIDQLVSVLKDRGYRTNTYTYQEHELMGSTTWIGYSKTPYRPIGITMGELTIPEANKARALEKCISAVAKHFCLSQDPMVSLEPLDEEGNIIRNPQVLDDLLRPVPETRYNPEFPYWKK